MPSDYEKICRDNLEEYGKGTKHLTFLERLYSERTHFIFELLQNAEDARATRVKFDLKADRLEVWHDGRVFNEKDVRGVCGIAEGTKENDQTQIGKFGIGFKSVYAFTVRPEIHCGDEHFAIEKYIRPTAVGSVGVVPPWTTLFILPFNRTDVSPGIACTEIAQRLANLNLRTMLFLRHILKIEWSSHDGASGCHLRQEIPCGPARRVSVVGETGRLGEETWLVFEAPVPSETAQGLRVEAAFSIRLNEQTGKESIAPVGACELSVFFPTEKATGLGFLIQGPYRTTPARDNVPKDDDWNKKLVEETAGLVASTLSQLRDLGLLTVDALRTMPIRQADFLPGTLFRPIFDSVAAALRTQPTIPTDSGEFVTVSRVRFARGGGLRGLFPPETLTALYGAPELLQWVSTEVTQDRTPDLYTYFRQILKIEELTPENVVRKLDRQFLEATSDDWLIAFYDFIAGQEALWHKPRKPWEATGPARSAPIIRLHDGRHVQPFRDDGSPAAYLSAPEPYGDVLLVKWVFVANDATRTFLQRLGIDEFDLVATIREKILPIYSGDSPTVAVEQNVEHIRLIVEALKKEKGSELKRLISNRRIVHSRNIVSGAELYRKPEEVYYDSQELDMYFAGNSHAWFLSAIYPEELLGSIEQLGVARTIRIRQPTRTTDWQGYTILADAHGYHERGVDRFDPDFDVDGLLYAAHHPTFERSAYVWEKIARPHRRQIRGFVEASSHKDFRNANSRSEWSKMGKALYDCKWLPHGAAQFVKPAMLSLDDLPAEFSRDEALASHLQMKVDEVAMLARKVGVDVELITQIANDQELCAQVRQLMNAKASKPDFPIRSTPDPVRRSEQVARDAAAAPPKTYEELPRSVRTSKPTEDPATWLREAYTNRSEQMICQMCKEEMPFKKRDGQYYFEAVESVNTQSREYHALYLALCPLCAAKFQELVKRDPAALQRFQDDLTSADEPIVSVQLRDEEASVSFVESHFLDLKTILRRDESA